MPTRWSIWSTYERNTADVDVAQAVAEIRAREPQALIMVNISVVDPAELIKLAGLDVVQGLGITQVMPYPYTPGLPVVREYQALLARQGGMQAAPSYVGLEAFVAAKVLVEGLRRAGPAPTLQKVLHALESLNPYDAGGSRCATPATTASARASSTSRSSAALPEDTFHALVEQSVAGIYILQDERFVYANAHWAGIVGLTPQEMIGGHLSRFVAPEDLDALLDKYYRRLRGDPPSMHFITRGLHADGRVLQIGVHGSRMLYRGRPAVMGVGIDVTERLRNEAELLRLREQLQALTAYTAAKLEEQRQQFARDVHDVLGGMLTSIKMDATRGPSRAAAACCTRCRPTRRRCGCRPSAPSRSTARSRRR